MKNDSRAADPGAGARNLLVNCAGAAEGSRLAILHEAPGLGFYGHGLAQAVLATADALGIRASAHEIGFDPDADRLPDAIAERAAAADHCLFLARLGDQLRFSSDLGSGRSIVSYALDTAMLGSPFGIADYRAFVALKAAIDTALGAAKEIRVTCALGTDFRGSLAGTGHRPADTTVLRFPMSVYSPVPAEHFRGRVALARFLVGTGSRYYQPYGVPLGEVLFAEIEGGRLVDLSGPADQVYAAREHYRRVGDRFGVDPWAIHSWHGGIHPGCSYPMAAAANYERWSGGAFGNPRLLHFHTCGAYAPGEICWNVVDPTVRADGVAIWENGKLHPERVPGGREILDADRLIAELFADPARDIGV